MLTQIQFKLLQMMKELDGICRKNDIHYSLGGGTAIGAIRHMGFIPWDDDIDLYMTRDNWDKLRKVAAEGGLPENRVLESAETDINYTNTIGRYVTTDSSSIHSHQIIYDDPAGHVIDIFVFDPLHIDNYHTFLEDLMLYSDIMDETKGYSSRLDMNIDRYPKAFRMCEAGNKKAVVGELVDKFTHMGDPGWQYYIMEWGIAPFLFPASIFDGGYIRVPFEDMSAEIVRNYSEYLTWQYGDEWYYIPRHEGREGHDAIFSNDLPYTVVRDDYMPYIDARKVRKAYIRRKKRLLSANPHRRKSERSALKKDAERIRKALEDRISEAGLTTADIEAMIEQGRVYEIKDPFEDYFKQQFSVRFLGRRDKHSALRRYMYPVLVPVGEELTAAAARILIMTERMSKAKRLIDVYLGDFEENLSDERRYSEMLSEIRQEILCSRSVIDEYSLMEGDAFPAALYDRVTQYADRYSSNSYILRIKARMLLRYKHDIAGWRESLQDTLETLEKLCPPGSPAYPEVLMLQADMSDAGGVDYRHILNMTSNGCLQLEICRKLGIREPQQDTDQIEAAPIDQRNTGREGGTEIVTPARHGIYGLARSIYRQVSHRDDMIKDRAWQIACRTRDRVELLEKYEPRLDMLAEMRAEGRWDEISAEMREHETAVLRNLQLGLGLCVHPLLTEIQDELLRKQGMGDIAEQVNTLIPDQHRRPIGR